MEKFVGQNIVANSNFISNFVEKITFFLPLYLLIE